MTEGEHGFDTTGKLAPLQALLDRFVSEGQVNGAAVAIAFVPVTAAVVLIQGGGLLAGVGKSAADLTGDAALTWHTVVLLGNGFILTSVVWASAVTGLLDRRFGVTAIAFAVASVAALFGLMHSPEASGAVFWPWSPPGPEPLRLAGAYGVLAVISWAAVRSAR